jgi:hypothetical protein
MLDKATMIFRILGEANVHTHSGAQLSSHSMGNRSSFARGKLTGL